MKLLLSSLLLASLCALSSWSVSSAGTLVVTQTPDVSVMEGETVNISCCWEGQFDQVKFNWLKNQTEIKNGTISLKNQHQESLKNESHHCSTLTFSNITREDSDRYICKLTVEIPAYNSGQGTGTVITVKTRGSTGDNTADGGSSPGGHHIPMIAAVAVVATLLLISLTCFCTLRWKQAQAARVIYEVPHIDSEVAEMDKHSTNSSTGSTEWCQVPVYESCDYFERVQTKESR